MGASGAEDAARVGQESLEGQARGSGVTSDSGSPAEEGSCRRGPHPVVVRPVSVVSLHQACSSAGQDTPPEPWGSAPSGDSLVPGAQEPVQ